MKFLPDFREEKRLWRKGYQVVIGVDEVGRGAFAGPLIASACAFPVVARGPVGRFPRPMSSVDRLPVGTRQGSPTPATPRIDDSKRLTPHERKIAAVWIKKNCLAYGIGEVGVRIINKVGIGKATEMAMRLAISKLISNIKARSTKQIQNSNNQKGFELLALSKFLVERRNSDFGFLKTFVLSDAFHIKYLRGIGLKNQKAIIKGDQKSISIAAASIMAKVYRDSLMQKLTYRYIKYQWGRNKGYGTKKHREEILKNGITPLHRQQFVQTFLQNKQNEIF